jgi:hypothetical protein|tara:strand:- start:273 stop:419 length:147 start_codon:yes stop_codon:yes gene_type:complete
MIIRAKRSMAYLNNQRSMNPPRLYGKKGLTTAKVDAIIKEQLEFNFNK